MDPMVGPHRTEPGERVGLGCFPGQLGSRRVPLPSEDFTLPPLLFEERNL